MDLSIPKPNGGPTPRILSRFPWIQGVTCAACAAKGAECAG